MMFYMLLYYYTLYWCILQLRKKKINKKKKKRFFRNRPIRNKNCLWWPCLLTDQDEMSNLYRRPSIYTSYQVSVHLAMQIQRRFFRNRPIRNKNCLRRHCLWTDRHEMNKLYRGPYIYASYQVTVDLAKEFQRRRWNCEKFTDGRRLPTTTTTGDGRTTDAKWWQ